MIIVIVVGGATVGVTVGGIFIVVTVTMSSVLVSLCSLIRLSLGVSIVLGR